MIESCERNDKNNKCVITNTNDSNDCHIGESGRVPDTDAFVETLGDVFSSLGVVAKNNNDTTAETEHLQSPRNLVTAETKNNGQQQELSHCNESPVSQSRCCKSQSRVTGQQLPRMLCDLGYHFPKERRPRKEKVLAIARQLVNFLQWQTTTIQTMQYENGTNATDGSCTQPAQVILVGSTNAEDERAVKERMEELSPDAPIALDLDQPPPRLVVCGLLIDRSTIQVNRSLRRAQTLFEPLSSNVEDDTIKKYQIRRWPLEMVAESHVSCNEPLNVDCVLEGMQQWYWNYDSSVLSSEACFAQAATQALRHHQERHPERPLHKEKDDK